ARSVTQKTEKGFNNLPGEYCLYETTGAIAPNTPATMMGNEPTSLRLNLLLVPHPGHIAQRDYRRRRCFARGRRNLKLFPWNKQSDPENMFQFLRESHSRQHLANLDLLNNRQLLLRFES